MTDEGGPAPDAAHPVRTPGGKAREPRPQRPRIAWRRVDGVLLLDKPAGISSNHALQVVRRRMRAERGGHTGTLDPLASGLLPLVLGEATKFAQGLLDADKAYTADVRLGVRTATGDAEGAVLEEREVRTDHAALERVFDRFRGEIAQVPPMYSALKRDGVALYTLARRGEEVAREARQVTIHALDLIACELPEFRIHVRCSKGTYIRQLAEDIGEALGCGAHLRSLRRTGVGALDVADAHPLAAVEAATEEAVLGMLQPVDALLPGDLPALRVSALEAAWFGQGRALARASPAGLCRVYGPDGAFLGIGETVPGDRLQPRRVVAPRTDGPATGV